MNSEDSISVILEDAIKDLYLEESITYFDKSKNIRIQVNPDLKRIGDEYFKVLNSYTDSKATKMARILFRKAEYVMHRNSDGKDDWFLNSSERKLLCEILNSKTKHTFFHRPTTKGEKPKLIKMTVFQYSIAMFNSEKCGFKPELYSNMSIE